MLRSGRWSFVVNEADIDAVVVVVVLFGGEITACVFAIITNHFNTIQAI
jgi:hypothetical protein